MKLDAVIRLTSTCGIDYHSKGAALKLAWVKTAQDLWSARTFGTDHRALFALKLREAHVHVGQVRRHDRQAQLAKSDPRIAALMAERDMLYCAPFGVVIAPRLNQIAAEIAACTASLGGQHA